MHMCVCVSVEVVHTTAVLRRLEGSNELPGAEIPSSCKHSHATAGHQTRVL